VNSEVTELAIEGIVSDRLGVDKRDKVGLVRFRIIEDDILVNGYCLADSESC
jgi:hypothetical protein